MKLYVILLNWNGWRDTVECVTSLLDSRGDDFVTIVCDNDSKDNSWDNFRAWSSSTLPAKSTTFLTQRDVLRGATVASEVRVVFVSNGGNLGFAGGNNVGMRLALNDPACRYVWVLNNDTVVAPDALSEVVARAESDPQIGLCGSTLIYYHQRDVVQAFGGASYNPATGRSVHLGAFAQLSAIPADPQVTERDLSYVVGAAMLVRRDYLEQVGLMQDDYFLYYEELDWAKRGFGHFRLGYAPRSVVYHKEGASVGTHSSGGSALSVFYLFRNRIRFTWRFYPMCLFTVIPFCFWDILKFILKGRTQQASAALRGTFQLSFRAMSQDSSHV